eukprot:scaffold2363_cov403-Prasinococcus_capsulatus_cf.AAC.4
MAGRDDGRTDGRMDGRTSAGGAPRLRSAGGARMRRAAGACGVRARRGSCPAVGWSDGLHAARGSTRRGGHRQLGAPRHSCVSAGWTSCRRRCAAAPTARHVVPPLHGAGARQRRHCWQRVANAEDVALERVAMCCGSRVGRGRADREGAAQTLPAFPAAPSGRTLSISDPHVSGLVRRRRCRGGGSLPTPVCSRSRVAAPGSVNMVQESAFTTDSLRNAPPISSKQDAPTKAELRPTSFELDYVDEHTSFNENNPPSEAELKLIGRLAPKTCPTHLSG